MRKRLLAPAMALAVAGTLAACSGDSAGPETGADVEDVAEEGTEDEPLNAEPAEDAAASFLGQTVTVSAEIEDIVNPQAFVIGADDELLVLIGGPSFSEMGFDVSEGLVEDDVVVQVTGTVARLVFPDIEDEFGFDWDDEALAGWEGRNVIVATEVDTLAGEPVTVAGEVANVLSTVSFRLAGVGWNVVVLDAAQAAVEPGEFVQVSGTVRQFNIVEFEEEFGLGWTTSSTSRSRAGSSWWPRTSLTRHRSRPNAQPSFSVRRWVWRAP